MLVNAAALYQIMMRAVLADFAVLQYINAVGINNCTQSVRDHDDGFALCKLRKCRLHLCFIIRVGKRGRFIQNQDRRIFQNGTGNRNTLLFTAG